MDTSILTHPLVRQAIEAMNNNNREAWMQLFSSEPTMKDDGNPRDFVKWSDSELFGPQRGYMTEVFNQSPDGLNLDARFHSDAWGDFNTYFNFTVDGDQLTGLDVGQQ